VHSDFFMCCFIAPGSLIYDEGGADSEFRVVGRCVGSRLRSNWGWLYDLLGAIDLVGEVVFNDLGT
jgi:hypothetical protein